MTMPIDSLIPPAPRTIEDTGLAAELVYEIATKTLHVTGAQTGSELAAKLGVGFAVIEPCIDLMKRERNCEISGGAIAPQSYVYRLTEAGHSRAGEFIEQSHYVGRLPVPLNQYRAYMDAFHKA